MTIDTSREAVERLNTHRVYIDRTMCFDEGITWTTVAGIYPHAYVPEDFTLALLARAEAAEAERDALQAEVTRLSTHPDDAETAALVNRLSGTPLYEGHGEASDAPDEAADALTRLSHALAAEKAKREAMEEALHTISGHVVLNNENDEELSDSALTARATLAKHGSK